LGNLLLLDGLRSELHYMTELSSRAQLENSEPGEEYDVDHETDHVVSRRSYAEQCRERRHSEQGWYRPGRALPDQDRGDDKSGRAQKPDHTVDATPDSAEINAAVEQLGCVISLRPRAVDSDQVRETMQGKEDREQLPQ